MLCLTIHDQSDVCELVQLTLLIELVEHDLIMSWKLVSTLHLPLISHGLSLSLIKTNMTESERVRKGDILKIMPPQWD